MLYLFTMLLGAFWGIGVGMWLKDILIRWYINKGKLPPSLKYSGLSFKVGEAIERKR